MMPPETAWSAFVRVPENRSALGATRRLARAVAQDKRTPTAFLPLFLHGPSGTGKSALLQALVQAVVDSPGGRTVSTLLANDIDPRTADEGDPLFEQSSTCDLLLVEDLQYLPERAATWLVGLLDDRNTHRRATAFTANVGPAALAQFPRRLTSRLSAGLVVPFEAYSPKSRLKILTAHAEQDRLSIPADVLKWIADRPTGGGMRPVLGILQSLKNARRNPLLPWTVADISALLAEPGTRFDAMRIVRIVAASFQVKEKDIRGSSRLKTVMLARQAAIYLARDIGKLSLPALGRMFERDHSSVLHSVRKIEEMRTSDADFRAKLDALRAELM